MIRLSFKKLMLVGCLSFSQVSLSQVTVTHESSPIKTRAIVDMTSASIQRGNTLTNGPSLQPSLWVFSSYGFGAGVWGSMSLQDKSQTNRVFFEQNAGEFQKIDLYLYYKVPTPDTIKFELVYAQYIYPEKNLLPDSTIRDSIAKFSLPVFLNPFVSVAYGLSDPIKRDIYAELGVQQAVFQEDAHSITASALTSYRNPYISSPSKQEGNGHSLVTLAYGYQGLKLAVNYIREGKKSVLDTTKATEFSTTAGYTAWF